MLRLDPAQRAGASELLAVSVHGSQGQLVPLSELVRPVATARSPFIYHKNLRPVTYVVGDVAGASESPVYALLDMKEKIAAVRDASGRPMEVLFAGRPADSTRSTLIWDGEWQVTHDVFLDMGIAFGVVMILIYLLVVGWFGSFVTPLIIMAPIPLTLIGVIPAHAFGGVFFTATSMIGVIALAGIIVRNSILLVDFINLELKAGRAARPGGHQGRCRPLPADRAYRRRPGGRRHRHPARSDLPGTRRGADLRRRRFHGAHPRAGSPALLDVRRHRGCRRRRRAFP